MLESSIVSELTKIKAEKIIKENFEYLDEVVEAAIVNILEDVKIEEGDNYFVAELQYTYDIYVAERKYGRKIV